MAISCEHCTPRGCRFTSTDKKSPRILGPRAFDFALQGEKKLPLFLCRSCSSRFIGVLLLEPLHPACRIDQLLLAGEEWMAVRADFDAYHVAFNRRARVKRVAAGAMHLDCMIIGMNSFFHGTLILPAGLRNLLTTKHTVASLGQRENSIILHPYRIAMMG